MKYDPIQIPARQKGSLAGRLNTDLKKCAETNKTQKKHVIVFLKLPCYNVKNNINIGE